MGAKEWWTLARGVNVMMGSIAVAVGALIVGAAGQTGNALPIAVFEIRQDLIGTEQGAGRWADILASALRPVLAAHGL